MQAGIHGRLDRRVLPPSIDGHAVAVERRRMIEVSILAAKRGYIVSDGGRSLLRVVRATVATLAGAPARLLTAVSAATRASIDDESDGEPDGADQYPGHRPEYGDSSGSVPQHGETVSRQNAGG